MPYVYDKEKWFLSFSFAHNIKASRSGISFVTLLILRAPTTTVANDILKYIYLSFFFSEGIRMDFSGLFLWKVIKKK